MSRSVAPLAPAKRLESSMCPACGEKFGPGEPNEIMLGPYLLGMPFHRVNTCPRCGAHLTTLLAAKAKMMVTIGAAFLALWGLILFLGRVFSPFNLVIYLLPAGMALVFLFLGVRAFRKERYWQLVTPASSPTPSHPHLPAETPRNSEQ